MQTPTCRLPHHVHKCVPACCVYLFRKLQTANHFSRLFVTDALSCVGSQTHSTLQYCTVHDIATFVTFTSKYKSANYGLLATAKVAFKYFFKTNNKPTRCRPPTSTHPHTHTHTHTHTHSHAPARSLAPSRNVLTTQTLTCRKQQTANDNNDNAPFVFVRCPTVLPPRTHQRALGSQNYNIRSVPCC